MVIKNVSWCYYKRASVDINDINGYTALMLSVKTGDLEMVEYLLSKGADLNSRATDGKTALSIAKENHQEMLAWLIERGAKA